MLFKQILFDASIKSFGCSRTGHYSVIKAQKAIMHSIQAITYNTATTSDLSYLPMNVFEILQMTQMSYLSLLRKLSLKILYAASLSIVGYLLVVMKSYRKFLWCSLGFVPFLGSVSRLFSELFFRA